MEGTVKSFETKLWLAYSGFGWGVILILAVTRDFNLVRIAPALVLSVWSTTELWKSWRRP
jgi:hypothetical protein